MQQDNFLNNGMGLFGEGVIVGIADSGIDYTNSVFRNQDGSTRILRLWDQVTDTVYSESDINQALMLENSYTKVNSRDLTGHGTHVAGIAAGNFADNKNNNLGIALLFLLLSLSSMGCIFFLFNSLFKVRPYH